MWGIGDALKQRGSGAKCSQKGRIQPWLFAGMGVVAGFMLLKVRRWENFLFKV